MTPVQLQSFRRFVSVHAEPTEVFRRQEDTSGNWGEELGYASVGDRNLYAYNVEEAMQPVPGGERQSLSVVALAVPSVDLQVNDRFDHGGERVEITEAYGMPSDNDPAIVRYNLDNSI